MVRRMYVGINMCCRCHYTTAAVRFAFISRQKYKNAALNWFSNPQKIENLYVQIAYDSLYANRMNSLFFLHWIEIANTTKLGKTSKSTAMGRYFYIYNTCTTANQFSAYM